jgi:hypothetical protein
VSALLSNRAKQHRRGDRSLGQARRNRPAGIIDVDPEWAALVGITGYMESFGPSFLGLSVSSDEIEQAARGFKVKLERIQLSDDPHRPCDETHLTNFHNAAKRSAPKAAACIERAWGNRGYPEKHALRTTLDGVITNLLLIAQNRRIYFYLMLLPSLGASPAMLKDEILWNVVRRR